MLKRALVMASVVAIAATSSVYAAECICKKPCPCDKQEQIKPEDRKAEMQKRIDELETKLKLTDEQKAQTAAIRAKYHAQMEPLFKKLEALRAEEEKVVGLKVAQATKDKRLAKIAADREAIKAQLTEIHQKKMEEITAVFTPKQKKQFEKIQKQRKAEFEARKKQCEKCPAKQ